MVNLRIHRLTGVFESWKKNIMKTIFWKIDHIRQGCETCHSIQHVEMNQAKPNWLDPTQDEIHRYVIRDELSLANSFRYAEMNQPEPTRPNTLIWTQPSRLDLTHRDERSWADRTQPEMNIEAKVFVKVFTSLTYTLFVKNLIFA